MSTPVLRAMFTKPVAVRAPILAWITEKNSTRYDPYFLLGRRDSSRRNSLSTWSRAATTNVVRATLPSSNQPSPNQSIQPSASSLARAARQPEFGSRSALAPEAAPDVPLAAAGGVGAGALTD